MSDHAKQLRIHNPSLGSVISKSTTEAAATEIDRLQARNELLEKVVEALDIFQSLLDKGYEGWPIGGPEHSGDWEEQRQLRLARAALKEKT